MAYKIQSVHNRYRYSEGERTVPIDVINSRLTRMRPYMPKKGKMLELGCGDGLLASALKKETGAEVYGVDISKSGVGLACKRGVRARVADLNKTLPYKDAYFDLIISDQALEHVYKPEHLLDEIYRVLKPDGIVITITPNLSFWLNRLLFLFGFYPIFLECGETYKDYGMKSLTSFIKDRYAVGHVRVFNVDALIDMFQRHQFIIREKKGLPLAWELPPGIKEFYNFIDNIYSLFPSLSRDILLVAQKKQRVK